MASGKRSRVRLSLGVEFDNLAAKAAFTSRFEYVRSLLTPAGQRSIDIISGFCPPCSTLWKGQSSRLYRLFRGLFLVSCRVLRGLLLQLVLCSHSIQMQVSTCLHICMSNKFYNGAIHI